MATRRTNKRDTADFDRQFDRATEEGRRRDLVEPRAMSARYDSGLDRVVIELTNGATFSFPPSLAEGLAGAHRDDLVDVLVRPGGRALHWPSLDVDFTVPGLLAGIFGTKHWMAELGRAGGRSTSEAKRTAARQNGRRGGRPRTTSAA